MINVMSDSEPSNNASQSTPSVKNRVLLIKSRDELENAISANKVRGLYKVRAEAPIDLVWAFHALTKAGYTYEPIDSRDGAILFSTRCSIWKLRLLWNTMNKDLHVMIESLDFANDYTGERYFTKYWDANTSEKKEHLAYYNSDNSDSEDSEHSEDS